MMTTDESYKMGRIDERLAVFAAMSALSQDKDAMKSAHSLFVALVRAIDKGAK
jgi:hypothetical protein